MCRLQDAMDRGQGGRVALFGMETPSADDEPVAARVGDGLQLCAETGLPSGTIYPIGVRLEKFGWVVSSWEDPAEHITQGRPRRRYYRLTDEGAEQARDALSLSL